MDVPTLMTVLSSGLFEGGWQGDGETKPNTVLMLNLR